MAFCQYCGKELSDGEVCSCQGSASTTSTSSIDVKALANGVVGITKDIVSDPEEGSKSFVKGISWLNIGIIAGIYALLELLYVIIIMVKTNIEYKDDWGVEIYKFGDIMKAVFIDLLQNAAGIAVGALIFFLAVKFIKKVSITWREAFAIAVIYLIVFVPLTLVNEILGFIPTFKLLTWIMASITAVRVFGVKILTYLALKGKCGDTKSTIYTAVPAIAALEFATLLVNFLINSLF